MYIDKYYNNINYYLIENNFHNDYYEDKYCKELKVYKFHKKNNRQNIKELKDILLKNNKNYKYLCSFFYTLLDLKNILRNLNQYLSGKKKDLYKRIYFYMCIMHNANYIQKKFKNYLVYKFNLLKGPAIISRHLCVNDTEFFTLDNIKEIHYENFLSYKDDCNFVYGFDIISIYNLFKKNKFDNPYTLKVFDNIFIQNIYEFIRLSKILNYNIDINIDELNNLNYNQKLINIFHEIDLLGNYTNVNWFKNLNLRRKVIFLRELHDIWVYRANIDINTKLQIYPYGDPFLNINFNNLHTNYSNDNFNNICVNILENFILYGINNSSKSLGALYILSALTIVSKDAAESLPWLYESVSYN